MSKLNALSQSMAALFTPESERARKAKAQGANPQAGQVAGGLRVPGAQGVQENAKSGDSLGNPMSPGYDGPIQKKAGGHEESPTVGSAPAISGETFEAPAIGPATIRLSLGFEKLLLTQKKLCEKAVALFIRLDAPGRYRNQRKGKLLGGKSRGCILDLHGNDEAPAPAAPPKKNDAA